MTDHQPPLTEDQARRRMALLTRRSLITGGVAAALGGIGLGWLKWGAAEEDGIPWPLRRTLQFNQRITSGLFSSRRLAPEFDPSVAAKPRANGRVGLRSALDAAAWKFTVSQPERQPQSFDLTQLHLLPRMESTTELKCIEGWSQVVHWAGVRLSDFIAAHGLAQQGGQLLKYVQLLTPDEDYYVGLDIASALHPQTMLCYEMNGEPLPREHGAPLRLVIPVKYGIKNLKRIGQIRFTNERPADYWAERGYDWYAGL